MQPYVGQQTLPISITYGNSQTQTSQYVSLDIDPDNLATVDDCGGSGTGTGGSGSSNLVASYPGEGGNISTANYPSSTLKAAALDAIEKVTYNETQKEDVVALLRISEILETDISSPDNYTERIKRALYLQMHKALNNAFQYGTLVNTENEETEPGTILEAVLQVIEDRLEIYNPSDSSTYSAKFRYTLDKAHALRIAGFYDDALDLLSSPSGWTFTYEQQMRAGYWACACQVERDYFEEAISEEDYIEQKETCRQQYAGYTQKSAPVRNPVQYTENIDHTLSEVYPQPVQSILNLEIAPGYVGIVTYEITDLAGRVVQASSSEWSGTHSSYNVQRLTTGVYFLKLHLNSKELVVKFVKE